MADNAAVLARLAHANIPTTAYQPTLKGVGQTRLHEIFHAKGYEEGGRLKSYLILGRGLELDGQPRRFRKDAPSVTTVCGLVAKLLVLQVRAVRYMPLSELIVYGNAMQRGIDHAYDSLGRGYIVIGDLGTNTKHYTPAEWDNAQDYLLHHVNRGGGLILGDNGWIETGNMHLDFIDALRLFEEIRIE